MTGVDEEEFTELVNGHFPRVDLVGKAANGVPRFLIAKSAAGPQGVLEAEVVRSLVEKAGIMPDDLDASTPLAEDPDYMDEPGDANWESLDAATAMKWVGILSRAKNAVEMLADREAQELFAGQADDGSVWDMEDACCAIQCAIDILAPYAVGEQAEADMQDEEVIAKARSAIAKAAQALDLNGKSTVLTTIETLAPVVKAGRVLSAQNETRIREAVSSLQTVLSSLPEPVAKEGAMTQTSEFTAGANVNEDVDRANLPHSDSQDPVAKEGALTSTGPDDASSVSPDPDSGSLSHGDDQANRGGEVTPTSNTTDRSGETTQGTLTDTGGSVMKMVHSADGKLLGAIDPTVINVQKAAGDPMMAVYTSSGKLLGAVDPSKITQLTDGDGDDADASSDADTADTADTGGAAMPPAPPNDLTPAPSGTVGQGVAKSDADQDDVIKAAIADAVKEATQAKDEQHALVVKGLEDRLAVLEAPAPSRVLSHGALPPTNMLRGMDKGAPEVDVAKAQELRDQYENARTAEEREAVAKAMNAEAVLAWQTVRDAR